MLIKITLRLYNALQYHGAFKKVRFRPRQTYVFILQNVRMQCGQFTEKNGKTLSVSTLNVLRRTLNLEVAIKILPPGRTSKVFLAMSRLK